MLGKIARGHDPRPKAASDTAIENDPSLKQAWEDYRDGHMRRKGRSEKTIAGYGDNVHRLMNAWFDKPLSYLGHHPEEIRALHNELTRESGPYAANAAMRTFRAIYNHARKAARSAVRKSRLCCRLESGTLSQQRHGSGRFTGLV